MSLSETRAGRYVSETRAGRYVSETRGRSSFGIVLALALVLVLVLVHEQQIRLLQQRAGNGPALLFASEFALSY